MPQNRILEETLILLILSRNPNISGRYVESKCQRFDLTAFGERAVRRLIHKMIEEGLLVRTKIFSLQVTDIGFVRLESNRMYIQQLIS